MTKKRYLQTLMILFILIIGVGATLTATMADAYIPKSFTTSKKYLLEDVYAGTEKTYLCGCTYTDRTVIKGTCNYIPLNPDSVHAWSVHADHVLPAATLGQGLMCYGDSRGQYSECVRSDGSLRSREDCCFKVSPLYKQAHNDLVNLIPVIGEINVRRSTKPFGEVTDPVHRYEGCEVVIGKDRISIPQRLSGDLARKELYMYIFYGGGLNLPIDRIRFNLLALWAQKDPPTALEIERNQRICDKQGVGNPFVSPCKTGF